MQLLLKVDPFVVMQMYILVTCMCVLISTSISGGLSSATLTAKKKDTDVAARRVTFLRVSHPGVIFAAL